MSSKMNNFSEENEHVRVCRVCLNRNVKMYDLQSYPLETYFEAIIGYTVMTSMDLPPYLCFECATLVKKFSFFRERCLTGQATLYGILQSSGKVTEKELNKIDRQSSGLTSKLSIQSSENNVFYAEEGSVMQMVKEEPEPTTDDFMLADYCPVQFKQEEDLQMPDFGCSSDDETLSVLKVVKEKKKRGRKKKVVVEVQSEELKNELDISKFVDQGLQLQEIIEKPSEIIEDMGIEIEPEAPKRNKRGRPRKNVEKAVSKSRRTKNTGGVHVEDIDLDEYVSVVKLTLEEQMDEITKRKDSLNYQNAAFQCNFCYKGFIDANAWKHHVGKHDPSAGNIECPVCKFRFPTKRALQKHATNHEKKYACKSCPYVSKTTTQAKQHQRWHKGVTYTCEYCDEVSTKWTSYLSHVRIKHPSSFICSVCGYSFVSQLGLTMHKTMMHKDVHETEKADTSEESGPYCQECDVKFVSMEAYNRHMVTSVKHSQSDDFSKGCRVCGATFSNPEELRLHHRKEHARKRPKNYGKKPAGHSWPAKCEHCSEVIPNAREYWTHFRRVHPDKNYPIQKDYVCDVCGKSFRGNAFLIYHKRTHSAERQYKCEECGKSFYNRTNLSMHARTHSNSRPYPCDVCRKAFKCKGALDRHYRSHTGVKPYVCEVCGKAFGQSNSRKLHVRTVHLKQPTPYVSRNRIDRRNEQKGDTLIFVYPN